LNINDYLKALGNNINKAIIGSNYKQIEIAEKLGVTRSTISRWVKGDRIPTASNLIKLAKLLKIDVVEFWQNIETADISPSYRKLLKLLNELPEHKIIAVLEVVKSMLPPPETQKLLEKISQLTDEKRKAIFTLADATD